MKALIVVDMPDGVSLDEWFAVKIVVDRLKATEKELMQGIPFDESKTFKFVPLRPLPQRKLEWDWGPGAHDWNACIDEILGETE